MYPPREDSFLLEEQVRKRARGKALDMGTGSGILAKAAKEAGAEVLAVDIQSLPGARQSDLFENVPESFDFIVFNPPYLPDDKEFQDPELHGGPTGRETLYRFLEEAPRHLNPGGEILFLQSSLTGIPKTEEKLRSLGLDFEAVARKKLFMEELVVYRAWVR